ncbi:iron chelate uptake ABC transporter family permease subunit [Microbacterium sp. ET2]|uniref:iron chelate uptake ABC transporter family permease subunit n=1 Tax=Microbacterium albipurpureum TaxID=3050384 RepID=UPI00259D1629|nr:iron chelate uptake ABC transporter family permease subunit [Microbacterium sp. ET2 (Ac-2212)]WJL94663.1 iron chelate uptake ABC transporter family permease subunit [Microbacterium sp. ET2 (Ac-2212)]
MTRWIIAGAAAVAALATISLFIGVAELDGFILFASRVPRTVSLILAGAAFAIIGLIMQLLVRNRFVEPGTTGATDAASLALLLILLTVPGLALWAKAALAAVGAVIGVGGFLLLARRIPSRSSVLVPVVGILYAGVIGAATTFIAYRTELLQELLSWGIGDFSAILRGRYEILFFAAAAAAVAWIAADRFTVAGLGDDTARGLGLDTRLVMVLGVGIIAVVTGILMVTTGALPFLGLIVPNIVSRLVGDNMRRAVPLVALLGAAIVLLCDIIGRVVRYPYELPISIVMGIIGGIVFLWMLVGRARPVDRVATS